MGQECTATDLSTNPPDKLLTDTTPSKHEFSVFIVFRVILCSKDKRQYTVVILLTSNAEITAMRLLAKSGLALSPAAFKLASENDLLLIVRHLVTLQNMSHIIDRDTVQDALTTIMDKPKASMAKNQPSAETCEILNDSKTPTGSRQSFTQIQTRSSVSSPISTIVDRPKHETKSIAAKAESDICIHFDPTGVSFTTGDVQDFIQYFNSRFKQLSSILTRRHDVVVTRNLSRAMKNRDESGVIAMVKDRITTRTGSLLLTLEDTSGEAKAIISGKNKDLMTHTKFLTRDQTLYFHGRSNGEIFLVDDVVWPDLPFDHRPNKADEPLLAAYISDLHVGSKMHLEDAFERLIRFFEGDSQDPKLRRVFQYLKYVFVCGDLVDGVGIYPRQETDLCIHSLEEQYKVVHRGLQRIPDHIEVIVIPGNHDATRLSEPQIAISKEFAGLLYDLPNVHMLGSPSRVSVHGVEHLLFHGNSLGDISSSLPGMSMNTSAECMREMLRNRHLAWLYGERTPISPEDQDHLVIDSIPDIFQTGHSHINAYMNYRGVTLLNSGAFQAQTAFQRSMGLVPTPGRVPIVNLGNLKYTELQFA